MGLTQYFHLAFFDHPSVRCMGTMSTTISHRSTHTLNSPANWVNGLPLFETVLFNFLLSGMSENLPAAPDYADYVRVCLNSEVGIIHRFRCSFIDTFLPLGFYAPQLISVIKGRW